MNNKKYISKIILFVLVILFGIFVFVYGGYDDSPGAQLLGLALVIIAIVGIVKTKKKIASDEKTSSQSLL